MVIHLANYTYTNKSFSNFFSFKQDKDFLALNKIIYTAICSQAIPEPSLFLKGLNPKQTLYLSQFLSLYLNP